MAKKKLATFDMDGTLVDTKDVNYFAYREALQEQGFDLEREYYCQYCNGRHYTTFLPPIIGDDRERLLLIHDRKKLLYHQYLEKAKVNQHLISKMKAMKPEYYCAVVTTASKKNCRELLDAFQLTEFFDLILTQEDIPKKKPDPEGFFMAMRHFAIPAENTIIFEDSETGVQAAEKTGADYYVVHGYN